MAASRMTVIKIAGRAGAEVMDRMDRWDIPREKGKSWGTDMYSARIKRQAGKLARDLIACAPGSPLVYRASWVDAWSIVCPGGIFRWPGARVVAGDTCDLWGWRLPDGGALEAEVARTLRARRIAQETRWAYARLREAAQAWSPPVSDACLLLIREPFAGSWSDDEVKADLDTGLMKLRRRQSESRMMLHAWGGPVA